MTRAIAALVVLAVFLPAAAQAQAPQSTAPPGNSAVDEYVETVPGAGGSHRARPPGANGGENVLSAAERARLERLGPDGKVLADAVESTAPAPSTKSRTKPEPDVPASAGRSPAGEVIDAVTGSDGGSGMGLLLPAILLATLFAAVMLILLRRRASS